MSIRVLIADDEAMVRTGLRLVLDREPDIDVIDETADGHATIKRTAELEPDVVLMDVRMPHVDGIEATRQIVATQGHSRVIVLTTFDEDEYVYDALAAGASGFLLKYAPADDLVTAIRVVAAGEAMLAPTVTRRLLERFTERSGAPEAAKVATLTTREQQVLKLVAQGMSNTEIADELILSRATVKTHIANILEKLDARDRVQAAAIAYKSRLMS